MNRHVFPKSGRGLGPGTSSHDFTDGAMSNIDVLIAACVDLARIPFTGHDCTGFGPGEKRSCVSHCCSEMDKESYSVSNGCVCLVKKYRELWLDHKRSDTVPKGISLQYSIAGQVFPAPVAASYI